MHAAKRAVDPSLHSGQSYSLRACRAIFDLQRRCPGAIVSFVEVPSRLEWGPQHEAHQFLEGLPPVPVGLRPDITLDRARKDAAVSVSDAWISKFQHLDYRGHQFMMLAVPGSGGRDILPEYSKEGSWLSKVKERESYSNALMARLVRCITNHAPIGEYYHRFKIPEQTSCSSCGRLQTRRHIFVGCRGHLDALSGRDVPGRISELCSYLEKNPTAFAFPQRRPLEEGAGRLPVAGVG